MSDFMENDYLGMKHFNTAIEWLNISDRLSKDQYDNYYYEVQGNDIHNKKRELVTIASKIAHDNFIHMLVVIKTQYGDKNE